ncbi:MAG TPA: alpha/beta hydrolase-fold protein [Terracidiphilus sp.]|jgi:S-formylglutathione hydrolase FrmB
MKAAFRGVILLGLLCAGMAGCGHRGPVVVDRPRSFAGVRMQDVTFRSAALGRDVIYRVYLPETVAPGAKLPVIYLLHGGGGGFRDWSNYSDVGGYAGRGYILVMPDGGLSYWINAALSPKDRYGDYFTEDLIHDVGQRYPAIADRSGRAVVGISMGGYASIDYALTRPELFGFAGAISPAVHIPSLRFSYRRFWQSVRLRRVFGPDDSSTRRAADPFEMVMNAAPEKAPYLYVTAGEKDPMLDQIKRFAGMLKQRGFAYEFHTKPGGHDWGEWDAQVPGCFERLMERVPRGFPIGR